MALKSDTELGVNSWLEDELYQQYLRDGSTVDESWKQVFSEPRPGNGAPANPPEKAAEASTPATTAAVTVAEPAAGVREVKVQGSTPEKPSGANG